MLGDSHSQEETWEPFLKSYDCTEDNLHCKTSGYMADMMGYLQLMYNFTWHSTSDPKGDWGVVPISGPPNANGTWGGVLGSLFEQSVQMSVSLWVATTDRRTMFDDAQFFPAGKNICYDL